MHDIARLPWLLAPPEDFRARCKGLRSAGDLTASELRALANRSLDLTQLGLLARVVEAHRDRLASEGALRPLRLGIAASHTLDLAVPALVSTGIRHGLLLEIHQTDYGQAPQEVLSPGSRLAAWKPDMVLLAMDASSLGLTTLRLSEGNTGKAVETALALTKTLARGVRDTLGADALVCTLPSPSTSLFGNMERKVAATPRAMVMRYNEGLIDLAETGEGILVDVDAMAADIGLARWHDPMRWHDAKVPFALDCIPLWADHICRLIAAARGLSRKCLVLDLDNTLWGGVIGDDGVEGIKLGQGSAVGEAHLEIQALALALKLRGVVLAVCSKNEQSAALLPFREHEEMVLGEDDIAAFVANWTDKASNLRHIAKTLNIGTDALVFLDDNPAERERVRQELPEVAVPEVGSDPSQYARILSQAGYFEAVSFGDEDRVRADMYRANASRSEAMATIGNLDDYLASLDMTCSIRPFDQAGRARIAQLVNKSNQFNLTTRRYTEREIEDIELDEGRFALQVRLVDRFGDNGMISVVIFDPGEECWHCDTWLMSCRVLGRRVEEAVLAAVAAAARKAGASCLTGDYLPTEKNVIVRDHFAKLGFAKVADLPENGSRWRLELGGYDEPDLPMRVLKEVRHDG